MFEPQHEISNNAVCATSKCSDQPAHTRSLTRAFACRLIILKGDRTGSPENNLHSCENAKFVEITCRGIFVHGSAVAQW